MENARFTLINTTKTTLGPASLIQYLQSKEINVSCIYAPKNNNDLYTHNELEILIKAIDSSEIVGFSSFSISEERTLQLMRYIKDRLPLKHLILGGPNAILDPERLIKEYGVDSICIHEGEIPLETLIKKYHTGNFNDILGLWFKEDGLIVRNPFQKPIQDIDEIYFTNYKKNYKRLTRTGLIPENNILENIENPSMPSNLLYVMASRGCPNSCSYCINDVINRITKETHSKIIRKKNSIKLISELKKIIVNEENINGIFFFDDDFFVRSESELIEFANEYKKEIGLPFYIFANPNSTTKAKLDVCYSAGLKKIEFGLQTISLDVLKKYNRKDGAKKIHEILQYIKDTGYNLSIAIDFISNSPFETEQNVIENINYILNLPGDFIIYIHNLHLFPGNRLRNEFVSGTGNENREFQDNIIEGKVFNEYTSKLLMAMQGFHSMLNPDIYGTLSRSEVEYFIKTSETSYNENLAVLNKKIKETEVAKHYSTFVKK